MDIKNMTTETLHRKMDSYMASLEFYQQKQDEDRDWTQADEDTACRYWVFYCACKEELELRGEL